MKNSIPVLPAFLCQKPLETIEGLKAECLAWDKETSRYIHCNGFIGYHRPVGRFVDGFIFIVNGYATQQMVDGYNASKFFMPEFASFLERLSAFKAVTVKKIFHYRLIKISFEVTHDLNN